MGFKSKNKKHTIPRYFSQRENEEYMQELLTVIEMDDRIKFYEEFYPDEKDILKYLRTARTYAQKAIALHRAKKDKDELEYSERRTRQYHMVIVPSDEAERRKNEINESFESVTLPSRNFKIIVAQALNGCFDCKLEGEDAKNCVFRKAYTDAGIVKGYNTECGYKHGGTLNEE